MYGKFPSGHPSVQKKLNLLIDLKSPLYDPHVLSKAINDALDKLTDPKKKQQRGPKKENRQ
jgi:hypothetical protein